MDENKRKGLFNTRRQSKCPIFGDPCDFSENQLPSYNAVMKCYLLVRNEMKSSNGKDYPVSVIASEVAEKFQAIYKRSSIPWVTKKRMIAKVKEYHQTFRGIMKSYQSVKTSAAFLTKLKRLKMKAKKLFDFASCKCKDLNCCNCAKEFKIPVLERGFMKDQRTDRKMYIGKFLKKRSLRRQQHLKLAQAALERSHVSSIYIEESVQDLSEFDEDSSNQEFVFTSHKRKAFTASGAGTFFRQGGLKIVRSCQRLGGEAPQTPLFSNARF